MTKNKILSKKKFKISRNRNKLSRNKNKLYRNNSTRKKATKKVNTRKIYKYKKINNLKKKKNLNLKGGSSTQIINKEKIYIIFKFKYIINTKI